MSSFSDPSQFINQLPTSIEIPKDLNQMVEIVSLLFTRITDAVNKKTGSLYYLQEFGNFQSFFVSGQPYQFRNGYRFVFDLIAINGGNIPGGGSITHAHGIQGFKFGTLIYATCTDTNGLAFTVTYPNATMDATNIYFTNPEAGTALVSAIFVAEYLKS